MRFADPGYEPVEGVVEDIVPLRSLKWRVTADRSVIEERFDESDGGTTVTVVHTSDAEGWPDHEAEAIALGWNESIADLVLFLEHRVRFTRHMTLRSLIGAVTRATSAGVEVVSVKAGTYAEDVGLQPRDLVVQLGRAPIFDRSDLALLMREHEPGAELEAVYVRGSRVLRRTARLSPRR